MPRSSSTSAVNTDREMQAVMVRYADDFVVLCRKGRGAAVYRRLKLSLERRKLKLNEEKTPVVNFEEDGLEFLGFRLSWRKGAAGGIARTANRVPKALTNCGRQ
jgi:hypothetical protein